MARGRPRWTPASIIDSTTKKMYAGPGAGDRGDGVLLALGDPQHLAGRGHQRLGLREVGLVAVGARRDGGHPLVDEGRRVGHDPDDGDPVGHPGLDEGGGDAGGQRDQQLTGRSAGAISSSTAAMSCGLTTRATVSAFRAASRLETTATPYRSSSSRARSGALLADQQVVDAAAGADQSGEQGLPHHAGADDGGLAVMRARSRAHFLEIRDFRKNDRFCGRSASRRIR